MQLDNWRSPDAPVWTDAEKLFKEKVETLPENMRQLEVQSNGA